MRPTFYHVPFALLAVLLLASAAVTARADWYPGDPGKWVQMPDESTNGMDVACYGGYVVGDDFSCIHPGPITNIHIWGSWLNDELAAPANVTLHLWITDDHPAGPEHPYSTPTNFASAWHYEVPGIIPHQWKTLPEPEGWYNPFAPDQQYVYPGDSNIVQYNIEIPEHEAFIQQGTLEEPKTYWLLVMMDIDEPDKYFGWKTSTNKWNDDAVYAEGPPPFDWQEMRYPDGHKWYTESVDLAFVIDGPDVPSPVEPKWSQPCDNIHGIDVPSYAADWETERICDDFLSDGRPIVSLRWWGSYHEWEPGEESYPPPTDPNNRPQGFFLAWMHDLAVDNPRNPYDFSMPDTNTLPIAVESHSLPLPGYGSGLATEVTETYYTSVWHSIPTGGGFWDHKYIYETTLTNEWLEKEGTIYWLGVWADYYHIDSPPANGWGWATTPIENNWQDDAVVETTWQPPWYDLLYGDFDPNHPHADESVNLAFELLTDVRGRRAKKWCQPPDMQLGVNMASYSNDESNVIRADDWLCDGRTITDIHWWGSYIGYQEQEYPGPGYVQPPPSLSERPRGFLLSWHEDIPAGDEQEWSMPGELLTNIFVPLEYCHEVFYGTVTQKWVVAEEDRYEHEFQYYVDFTDIELIRRHHGIGPWEEEEGKIYWLNIQAVMRPGWLPGEEHHGWGWKTTDPTNRWNDWSVVDNGSGLGWLPGEYPSEPEHPHYAVWTNIDLAFELTTDDVGTNKWYTPIVITNIVAVDTNKQRIWSVGTWGSGTQILEKCPDLVLSNWVGVATKPLPLPPPWTNVWNPPASMDTQRNYRVIERR